MEGKTRRNLILVLVLLAIAATIGTYKVKASPQVYYGKPCTFSIPAEWGEFRSISKYGLVFEDKAGTLRVVDQTPCEMEGASLGQPRVAVEIRRK